MKPVWALGLLSLAIFAGLGWFLQPLQPSVVALQLTFSSEAFQAVLDAWGVVGVQRFRQHLLFDDLLLLSYGAFGYLLVRRSNWFVGFGDAQRRHMVALMPLAALCDAAENLLHGYLSGEGVAAAPALYGLAGGMASLKWLLLGAFVVCCLLGALKRRAD